MKAIKKEGTANTVFLSERDLKNYQKKLRRQRELRKRIFLVAVTACLVFGFTFCFHAMTSYASTGSDTSDLEFKYYSSITVKAGDSLWSIAQQYADDHYDGINEYIAELISINHLRNDTLKAGQYLIVPFYSEEFLR